MLYMHVDTQSSFLLPAYWKSILCQDQSVSKVETKSLALVVANFMAKDVVSQFTIIIPLSAVCQPLLLLVLVARRGEAMLVTPPPL